jgi:hypothetical protein
MAVEKISIVLRLAGATIGQDRASLISEFRPSRVWTAGERKPPRGTYEESGFSVLLAESENPVGAMGMAERVLERIAERITLLVGEGASGEVDCGLMMDIHAPMASIRFTQSFANRVAALGLELLVSFYPAGSDRK